MFFPILPHRSQNNSNNHNSSSQEALSYIVFFEEEFAPDDTKESTGTFYSNDIWDCRHCDSDVLEDA